jgi:hypothetical protein
MTTMALKSELLLHLNRLPTALQCQVLQFTRALEMTTLAGVSGTSLITFAGCIPQDDLNVITQAVAEGCGRVDAHEW